MTLETVVMGPVGIILLVIGMVEAAKRLGVEGKWSFVLALSLGFVFAAYLEALAAGIIPPEVVVAVRILVVGIGGGLAATGLYDLHTRNDR